MAGERAFAGLGLRGFYTDGSSGWGATVSEDLRKLSALSQITVASRTLEVADYGAAVMVIVRSDDATNANKIGVVDNGTMVYFTPVEGWMAFVQDAGEFVYFDGSAWTALPIEAAAPTGITRETQAGSFSITNAHLAGNVLLSVSSASGVTVTVPSGLTGTEEVTLVQRGAGQITLAAGGGVNLRSADGRLKSRVQYSSLTLVPTGTIDEYYVIGDLAA